MIDIKWIDLGREPQAKPNPAFPDGIDLDLSKGQKSCETRLPYPAKRCGYYILECDTCHMRAVVTTAGRPDDPCSVKLACKTN
jgi:hypothetical protein